MRDDTRLVLIDIPGINEAGSSSDSNNNNNNNNNNKYKDYVESNWDTFDCVICVLDAIQGVNTQEQIELLKFIKRNNDNLKKIPTIILGNKMDDLNDDDTQNLIEETRLKTIEIFGNDCYDCAQFKEEEDGYDNDNDNDALPSRSSAVFIPLSAKNAFMYRKAGNINLNELEDIKYRDVVNKIGYDEYGRKWSKMNIQQQIESVIEILSDPDEYNMRLAGTNFHTFLNVLTYYAGGNEAQKYLLSKQIDIELSRIANGSNKKSISESIYKVYKRCKAIDRTDETTNDLKDTFWNGFQDCERKVFLDDLNKTSSTNNNVVNSTSFERLFFELEKYNELSTLLGWTEESSKAIGTMKRLLRRQISFLLEKIEKWNFDSFCGEVSPTINTVKNHCTGTYSYCAHTSSHGYSCNQSFNKAHAEYSSLQFKCGVSRTVFESKWKVPENVTWENLSPHDWITILSSLSLVWNQSRFIEDFGMEKVKLEELLSMFRMVFTSIFGLSIDGGEAMVGSSTYYVQAYKDAIKQYGKDDAIMKVMMPHTLTDPSHWGYFAWKYIKLCDGKNLVGPVSEFGENADAKPVELASSDISKDVDVKPMEE
jgi:GTPase SAR1 family protein